VCVYLNYVISDDVAYISSYYCIGLLIYYVGHWTSVSQSHHITLLCLGSSVIL